MEPVRDPGTDAGRIAALVGLLLGLAGTGSAAIAVTLPAIAADLDLTTGGVSVSWGSACTR